MSYYGIKNLKIIQLENGKYNCSCDYYDSSISTYDYKRVWHHSDRFNTKDTETKEETEKILFKDFLDGNLHGACGKFACIEWGKCMVELPKREIELLTKMDKNFWDKYKETKQYNRHRKNRIDKIRYALYYRAWKKFLQDKKENSYIIKYNDDYVVNIKKRSFNYSGIRNNAKVFKGLPTQNEKVQNLLKCYPNNTEIIFL